MKIIIIKNTRIFKCGLNRNIHWSKLPKMKKNMIKNILNLRRADLRGAILYGADLRGAILLGADLREADLREADLQRADLREADLREADLQRADLREADLREANLRDADLREADFREADLRGADLKCAKLAELNGEEIIIKDLMTVTGLGTCNRQTIIFNTNIGIVIQCGCFYGTETQFKKEVKRTHANTNFEKEYDEMLKLAEIRFKREK